MSENNMSYAYHTLSCEHVNARDTLSHESSKCFMCIARFSLKVLLLLGSRR